MKVSYRPSALIPDMADERHGETFSPIQELSTRSANPRKLLKRETNRHGKQAQKLIEQAEKFSKMQMRMKLEQHRECAQHIKALNTCFSPSEPSVFAYAVAIMDSAILRFSIPEKYRSCFSTACYLIAVKLLLDDFLATPASLAHSCDNHWGHNDLVRMEVKVMEILGWEVPLLSTYLELLPPIMHELFEWDIAQFPHPLIISQAQDILVHQFSFVFKPAALVLGILNFMIQRSIIFRSEMNERFLFLQDLTQVLDSELHEIDVLMDNLVQNPRMIIIPNKIIFPMEQRACRTFMGQLYTIAEVSADVEDNYTSEANPTILSPVDSSSFHDDCIYCKDECTDMFSVPSKEDTDSGCDHDSEDESSSCDDWESKGNPSHRHVQVSFGEDSGVANSSSDES